jgi:nucleotide-binding universal stress UspA family protein
MGATVTLIHVGREALSPAELLKRIKLSSEDVHGLIIDQCTGSPADAIVRAAAARHAVLIVCVALGWAARRIHLEACLETCCRRRRVPVVLVPSISGTRLWTLRQLVLPHNGTQTSAAAIAPTADLASRAGADLVVLHVATPSAERPTEPGTFAAPRYLDQAHHEWPMWAREFLERVRGAGHPANLEKIRLVLTQGETSTAILEFAQRNASDLIALAWRGGFEPDRAQTIRRVIRGARCPVIVFRVKS